MESGKMIRTTVNLAIALLMISSNNVQVTTAQLCGGNVTAIINECRRYYFTDAIPNPPRPDRSCCSLLHPIDVPCACAFVTQDVMNLVDLDKAVSIYRSCGRKIAKGYKCGSYTIPPKA